MTAQRAGGEIATPDLGDSPTLLTTIVISYNTRELTLASLAALNRSTAGLTAEIIVVDNASADHSAEAIAQAYPRAVVIGNSDNVGFAKAVNQALPHAHGEFVMLLNPDCIVEPATAATLIGFLREHRDVGVVAPLVTHPEGRLNVLSAGFLPNGRRIAAHFFGLSRLRLFGRPIRGLNLLPGPETAGPCEVEWVSGACLVAPKWLFDDLGGLSDRWFMYAEDMEFCARVIDRGLKVVHLPEVTVTHEVGASSKGASTLWIDNLEDFYIQHFRPTRVSLYGWRLIFTLGLLARSIAYRVRAVRRPAQSDVWMTQAHIFDSFVRRSLRRRSTN